ncbi:MAG: hypothetical protein EBS90_12090 [Betaproteobacteria bacterium]|nr:hypothetical protein [Betaproteobacteria bacterium]
MNEYMFPSVCLMDPLGTKVVLSESRKQDGCAVLRIEPRMLGSAEPELTLNRSTAVLLRQALKLWIRHLDTDYVVVEDPEEDVDD